VAENGALPLHFVKEGQLAPRKVTTMDELFVSNEMSEEEAAYEAYPYKDYNGWQLDIGSLVQFAGDDRTYGQMFRIVVFTLDSKKALITAGEKKYWVTLSSLRWVR